MTFSKQAGLDSGCIFLIMKMITQLVVLCFRNIKKTIPRINSSCIKRILSGLKVQVHWNVQKRKEGQNIHTDKYMAAEMLIGQ